MLKTLKGGIQACVQDFGRQGYRHLGVSQTGVLDPLAMNYANALLHNEDNTPVIEITVGLCHFEFLESTNFAIMGADLAARLNGKQLESGWRYSASAGDKLTFSSSKDGLRAYLAIQGGFKLNQILDSYSTDLQAGFGGFSGHALKEGDILHYERYSALPSVGAAQPLYDKKIRVMAGPHCDLISDAQYQLLFTQCWQVLPQSNRMGIRMESERDLCHAQSIPSQAVTPGVVQLPPNGKPIILSNDCQTTGGYPIIAQVIEADLRHLSQLAPGQHCAFELVTRQDATNALQIQRQHLAQFKIAINNNDKNIV
ncbi:biotin-dependent carboxyltransferase family protein [Pseudoalteromonas luteoviolacea]|uniref:5-oxoprolinase subunit C family protein n=1 Tax=Pseudoalteromonas luteoviolacea TaxID=43657 RepID=UPI001B35E94C|nr:biotin-dependent carboxyltransferase family protein [Pseudoalteromonas luteoviolacea]MBQ4809718.1 biotin-dependent carboxyltransferase family protein [Pseudoalteromonas luteoviolacea]